MSQARQRWTERLDRYRQSGLTVTDFCAEEGVSVPSFYAWKRQLTPPPTLVPIHLTSEPPPPSREGLEVVLPSGLCVRVPAEYPPEQLATLLIALETRSC